MQSRLKSETSQLAVIRSIAYLQLTPVMTEVLTILTGVKAKKKKRAEGKRETERLQREAAVGNSDNLACMQRQGDLVKVSKQVVKPKRRLRSNQG